MKNMGHDRQQKCSPLNFPLLSCSGENLKMPWKCQGKLREFSFSKMWPPCFTVNKKNTISNTESIETSQGNNSSSTDSNVMKFADHIKIWDQLLLIRMNKILMTLYANHRFSFQIRT